MVQNRIPLGTVIAERRIELCEQPGEETLDHRASGFACWGSSRRWFPTAIGGFGGRDL
jgi:hypothetical protein